MKKITFPIHHTFAPLVTREQFTQAFRMQIHSRKWKNGSEREELRNLLSHSFGASVSLFASGRESLLALFKAMNLGLGDEVIVQGFTCVAVPNAIHASGATVIFAEIDPETLNLDCDKIQGKITPRTRAIICQHTFGIPADTARLRSICDKRNLLLIEDCAHVIPDVTDATQYALTPSPGASHGIGEKGDVIMMSFGRDKAVSGVTGGALCMRNADLARKVALIESKAVDLSKKQIKRFIEYPIRYTVAKRLWRLPVSGPVIAKSYLRSLRMTGILPQVLSDSEKKGGMDVELHKLPNACAAMALEQLKNLSVLNEHRRKITAIFREAATLHTWAVPQGIFNSPVLQKFPVFAKKADNMRESLKREQIYLDDGWCGAVVNPRSVDQSSAGYEEGSLKMSEDVAKHIVTLPVHPTMTETQAQYLVHAVRRHLEM